MLEGIIRRYDMHYRLISYGYLGICGFDHSPYTCFAVYFSFVINLMFDGISEDDLIHQCHFSILTACRKVGCVPQVCVQYLFIFGFLFCR